ncbi:golgin subfamily A member 6-like protein 6 isoform X2 [Cucumis melo var. makuwa]|uniref:Golgin subfamily A member 6-like protein 6 isoform X2 n=2 Tax=Cucumis melo TaxID=3656 RepID=A0A5D3CZL8_CUCMM|nr:protein disulfide isomerase pTAC5, chloroplastic [Cucumis melo]KAA0049159.1 golgin subfamily A member 6-like protein 6 isoform X2 [Cucumis melo var. makuwa]TYK17401.1 golgin subfamily A member 6-like protein 6 isoform X2 [Cucumis melo var. makuwa]
MGYVSFCLADVWISRQLLHAKRVVSNGQYEIFPIGKISSQSLYVLPFPLFLLPQSLRFLCCISMSSSITLPLNPSLLLTPRALSLSVFSSLKLSSSRSLSSSLICRSLNPASNDREELRWIREEQRWFREEERWIREEQRWARERQLLLQEIAELKLQIQALERRNSVQGGTISVSETIANIAGLLQVLKEKNLIAESGPTVSRILLDESSREEDVEIEKKTIVEEVVKFSEESKAEKEVKKERKSLRVGSEGAEVLAMQEALLGLGFYCGEEDMEFSSFSSGTERAVKTWQSASGFREDGIMTTELLEILFKEKVTESVGSDAKTDEKGNIPTDQRGSENGTVINSITEIQEIQKTIVKEGSAGLDLSEQRVFLIGENRWEDPTRLHSSNGKASDGKTKVISTNCLTCRGEGRLLCTECDGTGEPNIEPQFLEWVDEGMKCPYCEGVGYITCDVCEGKTVA